jgi:hypothetical protein
MRKLDLSHGFGLFPQSRQEPMFPDPLRELQRFRKFIVLIPYEKFCCAHLMAVLKIVETLRCPLDCRL